MKKCWLVSGILGIVAAIVYFASMPDVANLNLIAPICGSLAVVTLFHLVRFFVAANLSCRGGRDAAPMVASEMPSQSVAILAGFVASVVFMLTPAVRSAATHFEPRLVDATWALLIAAMALPFLPPADAEPSPRRNKDESSAARLFSSPALSFHALLSGASVALGLLDSALFLALAPLYLALVAHVSRRACASRAPLDATPSACRNKTRSFALHLVSAPVFSFFLSALLVFFIAAGLLHLNLNIILRRTLVELSSYYGTPGWFFVFFFTTLPFLTILFSEDGALRERPGFVQLLFHGALTFVTILAVVPPLSPSALMAPCGRLPVVTSAFAAAVAGYLVAYWWINRTLKTARVIGGILVLALAGLSLWNLFAFDARSRSLRRVVIRMDANRAQEILRKDPDSPLANYVMGSLALKAGRHAEAGLYLRKAVAAPQPLPFALNDYAEFLRSAGNCAEAERYARKSVECAPNLYIGWETLGSVLMDADKDLVEAEAAILKACELSKGKDGRPTDMRMLVSLARVRLKRGETSLAQETVREIQSRMEELSDSEREDFERLLKK